MTKPDIEHILDNMCLYGPQHPFNNHPLRTIAKVNLSSMQGWIRKRTYELRGNRKSNDLVNLIMEKLQGAKVGYQLL